MERYTAFTYAAGKRRYFRVWHSSWPQVQVNAEITEHGLLEESWPFFREARMIGANFSPHHGGSAHTYLGEVFQWVSCFREDGMTLPWAEDYIFQIPVGSQQMALQRLADLREQQAASLAYFDVFWVAAVLGVALVFLVLLMKPSVAEKGAHVGAE